MYLMFYLDDAGKRVYTLQVCNGPQERPVSFTLQN